MTDAARDFIGELRVIRLRAQSVVRQARNIARLIAVAERGKQARATQSVCCPCGVRLPRGAQRYCSLRCFRKGQVTREA